MAGSQHDHWCLLALPQCSQQAEAINPRKHCVEDDQVIVAMRSHMKTVYAIRSHINHVALFSKPFAKVVRDLGFIFHDKKLHEVCRSLPGFSLPVQIVIFTFCSRSVRISTLCACPRACRYFRSHTAKDLAM